MKKGIIYFSFFILNFSLLHAQTYTITTFAGNGRFGTAGDGGPATAAPMDPGGITTDKYGNVFFTSPLNHVVRKIDTRGIITKVAGRTAPTSIYFEGDARSADSANLYEPMDVAIGSNGNLYICGHMYVCMVDDKGLVWSVCDRNFFRTIPEAKVYTDDYPGAMAMDSKDNIYFPDFLTGRVREAHLNGYKIIAGDGHVAHKGDGGPAELAELANPTGIAIDATGNLYVTEQADNCIRKIDTAGIITTITGKNDYGDYGGDGGPATNALFKNPTDVAVDDKGNIFIADCGNNLIRRIDTKGNITTIAGSLKHGFSGDGGPATAAEFDRPWRIALDAQGNIYVVDQGNLRIRKLSPVK